jgi:hypothetical protein
MLLTPRAASTFNISFDDWCCVPSFIRPECCVVLGATIGGTSGKPAIASFEKFLRFIKTRLESYHRRNLWFELEANRFSIVVNGGGGVLLAVLERSNKVHTKAADTD